MIGTEKEICLFGVTFFAKKVLDVQLLLLICKSYFIKNIFIYLFLVEND